jgi:uncharacterized protein (DUF362 family)
MSKPTVILRSCPDYDASRIQRIVEEGLDALELRPFGRTLVKPNVVASGARFPHAYTRPEFVEGVLRALRSRARADLQELAVGERCGITMPTRFAFGQAGYYEMAERVGNVKLHHFDEVPQVEIPLYHPERLRDSFFTPEPVARADFFVNCPKFKAHPWTTVTFSMKNYIGIQDDRHRLLDHDHKLDEKVADLQYIVQPQFIAIDGVIAGEGRMLTPIPFDMKLVAMGDNQLAFDAVCCHIIGVNPLDVAHLRLAYERGFGPVRLDEIRIIGDLSLDQAKARAKGFRVGLIRVEEYFKGTNIQGYGGTPPSDTVDYCWGGCPGALEEAVEIARLFDDQTDTKMPKMHVVFGRYEGEIDAKPDEKVVFIGDCASYKGRLGGKDVDVPSTYVDRSQRSPYDAKAPDIFAKMASVRYETWKHRADQVVKIAGCPVSVAEQLLLLVQLGGLKDPYLDPSQAVPFMNAYFTKRTHNLIQRILGNPYQLKGPTPRGAARPVQNLPPSAGGAPGGQKPLPLERAL